MSGRIHVDPVRRSPGTRIDTTQTYARIRRCPSSLFLTRLEAASRMQRVKPLGGIHFWFTGTEAEAYALLDLAAARAPTAVLESSRGSWRRAPEPERRPRPRAFPFRSS
jgi:hypothetical protein